LPRSTGPGSRKILRTFYVLNGILNPCLPAGRKFLDDVGGFSQVSIFTNNKLNIMFEGNGNKKLIVITVVISIVLSSIFGVVMGFWGSRAALKSDDFSEWTMNDILKKEKTASSSPKKIVKVEERSAIVDTVKEVSPAVVSIVVTKDLPKIKRNPGMFNDPFFREFFGEEYERFFRTPNNKEERQETEVGGGSGFIVSSDGYVVTNKHVVTDEEANYTVVLSEEEEYKAEVLARDTTTDLAILKIEGEGLPFIKLGDSSSLQVGQKVIAIGNALGEFRDTVSTGVVSGLSRSITARGAGTAVEQLSGLIQTDASINPGNSGGPLLNIDGQVIGINTAMARGAENIGFALPINEAKNIIRDVKEHGRIIRPWLGVRYVILDEQIAEANDLPVERGALIIRGETRRELAVIPGSPAAKAGLQAYDIILKVEDKEINKDHTLAEAINEYEPGDKITVTVWQDGEENEIEVELEERK
jgi:S1-C subfamily serine protease